MKQSVTNNYGRFKLLTSNRIKHDADQSYIFSILYQLIIYRLAEWKRDMFVKAELSSALNRDRWFKIHFVDR